MLIFIHPTWAQYLDTVFFLDGRSVSENSTMTCYCKLHCTVFCQEARIVGTHGVRNVIVDRKATDLHQSTPSSVQIFTVKNPGQELLVWHTACRKVVKENLRSSFAVVFGHLNHFAKFPYSTVEIKL